MMELIRSMTGYGRFEGIVNGRKTVFEIKSVNHRFLELQCRIPKGFGVLEENIAEIVNKNVKRGKVDVYFSVEADENVPSEVKINHSLASGYVSAMKELCNTYGLKDDISVSQLCEYSDIFTVSKPPENEDALREILIVAANAAIDDFVAMRRREGEKLCEDVKNRCEAILSLVSAVEQRSPKTVEEYRTKLYDRLCEILEDKSVDTQRILTEAAVFADKTAVAEETVRLRSHIGQFEDMLKVDEPVGRKLDFIVQEMNREANTIGSKVCDAELAHIVVDIKSEIEKIREQIQNIE